MGKRPGANDGVAVNGAAEEARATSDIKVMEVDAFSSVHDMIHAAITSNGVQATLRQVYQACQLRGRIAYKKAGGSRLITHNDHWKSQIRHALYTCDRFQRVAEGADLWMISPRFHHMTPLTLKVLIRGDTNADSVCDEHPYPTNPHHPKPPPAARPQRRATRAKPTAAEEDPPFLATNTRRKRTSYQTRSRKVLALTSKPAEGPARPESPHPTFSEHVDECSHIDSVPGPSHRQACPPQVNGNTECTMLPSPWGKTGASGDASAWQRAARQLNTTFNGVSASTGNKTSIQHFTGSDDPSMTCERSAEAESRAAFQPLYALRSLSKPPPGFGANPDPAAEQAAREAHARTTGPLKKRLKAAAKAAERAVSTGCTGGNEEATSTHTAGIGRWLKPHSFLNPTLEVLGLSTASGLPPTPPQNLRSRGSGLFLAEGMGLGQLAAPQLTTAGSSVEAYTHVISGDASVAAPETLAGSHLLSAHPSYQGWAPPSKLPRGHTGVYQQGGDVEEGADETDEGGGKRLLRSHAAAAAADTDRENSMDRTDWIPRANACP